MAASDLRSPLTPKLFRNIKFFVFCHSVLQLSQLLVSGYMKSSISTIERRYGLSSQRAGLLAAFNEVGNTVLIVFVSFLGSRVHRPRFIAGGALVAAVASLLMALPHFIYGPYDYTDHNTAPGNSSGLCQSERWVPSSNQSCSAGDRADHQGAYPLLLMGQLLLGIGAVPIQPFGISYIDDFSSKRNSPLYLGILLAFTSIGPAFGFITSSLTLRLFVDFNTVPKDQVQMEPGDLRWVGAWWLGFLMASSLLVLTALPILFFPRELPPEDGAESGVDRKQTLEKTTLLQFLKSFPRIAGRTLKTPVYLSVVLAQVNLSALLSGLATFMAKFMERQFNRSVGFSNMMIGGVALPFSIIGIVLGGALMRRCSLTESGAGRMCFISISLCVLTALPLLMIGCSTQRVSGVYPTHRSNFSLDPVLDLVQCGSGCNCPEEAFNPVCGSDGVEFRSPCHAGCVSMETDSKMKVTNYTNCGCVSLPDPSPSPGPTPGLVPGPGPGPSPGPGPGWAIPGTCGSPCSHLLLPFMCLVALTCFIASFCHTPSYIIILRTVPVEDKSFAVGLQYMFFRVLAFMPGPVLYGKVIDTTCILWGRKCNRQTSCHYYDLDLFRHRFLGLQLLFVCGGLLCFFVTMILLRRRASNKDQTTENKTRYELVNAETTIPKTRPKPE